MKPADDFSHGIIGAAVEVQRVLGTGLPKGAYAAALAIELAEREVGFAMDVPLSAEYKGKPLGVVQRADFIVEHAVLVQLEAVEGTSEQLRAEALAALRVSGLDLGLLVNFNVFPVVKGVHRLVNKGRVES